MLPFSLSRWAVFVLVPLLIVFLPSVAFAQDPEVAALAPASTDWGLVLVGTGYTFMLVALLRHHLPKIDGWLVPVLAVPIVAVGVSVAQVGTGSLRGLLTHAALLYVGAYGGAAGIRKVGAWALAAIVAAYRGESIPPPPSMSPPPEVPPAPRTPRIPPGVANSLLALGVIFGFVVLTAALGGCAAAQQIEEVADDSGEFMAAGSGLSQLASECFDERKDLRLEKCAPDDAACKAAADAEAHEADGFIATMRRIFCKYAQPGACS